MENSPALHKMLNEVKCWPSGTNLEDTLGISGAESAEATMKWMT